MNDTATTTAAPARNVATHQGNLGNAFRVGRNVYDAPDGLLVRRLPVTGKSAPEFEFTRNDKAVAVLGTEPNNVFLNVYGIDDLILNTAGGDDIALLLKRLPSLLPDETPESESTDTQPEPTPEPEAKPKTAAPKKRVTKTAKKAAPRKPDTKKATAKEATKKETPKVAKSTKSSKTPAKKAAPAPAPKPAASDKPVMTPRNYRKMVTEKQAEVIAALTVKQRAFYFERRNAGANHTIALGTAKRAPEVETKKAAPTKPAAKKDDAPRKRAVAKDTKTDPKEQVFYAIRFSDGEFVQRAGKELWSTASFKDARKFPTFDKADALIPALNEKFDNLGTLSVVKVKYVEGQPRRTSIRKVGEKTF